MTIKLVKTAVSNFKQQRMNRWAASITYYMLLSLAPLLLLISTSFKIFLRSNNAKQQILDQFASIVPTDVLPTIDLLLTQTSNSGSGIIGLVIGFIILLFTASSMVLALQDALHVIWSVRAIGGLRQTMLQNVKAISMVFVVAFLMMLLTISSVVITAVAGYIEQYFTLPQMLVQFVNVVVLLLCMTLLFAALIRLLSGIVLPWGINLRGALLITVLFIIGQVAIALYLHFGAGSFSGAVGALIVLLVWLYYSVQVFLLGVELTRAYVTENNLVIQPDSGYAYETPAQAKEFKGSVWQRIKRLGQ